MPVESATFINTLVPANPIHTDGLDEADAHPRLIKAVLQNQFPNLGPAAVTATAASINQAAATSLNPGVLEVAGNGATGAELKLDHGTGSGDVILENTGTSGNPGALAVVINDATNANPQTALTVTRAGEVTATASLNAPSVQKGGNELVPTGIISLWYGSLASIPAGWHLCDGTNGTPDLRDRFVVGAGNTYAVTQTGGAAAATTATDTQGTHSHGGATGLAGAFGPIVIGTTADGAHAHGGGTESYALTINDMPSHSHQEQYYPNSFGQTPGPGAAGTGAAGPILDAVTTGFTGGGAAHAHGIITDGSHGHTATIPAVGNHQHAISGDGSHLHNVTVATLPPFYALAYIMKL